MRLFGALLGVLTLVSAAPALARPFRVSDIPNGSKNTCLNCHIDLKASAQNDFGGDAQSKLVGPSPVSSKHVDWTPLCPIDSDHDGWTNGQELGDPDCTWKAGDMNPSAAVFNPGDPDSHPPPVCNNGKLDADEDCEGSMMSETDCATLDAGVGSLSCGSDCRFDYSACSAPPDGTQDPGGDPGESGGCSASGGSNDGAAALLLVVGLAFVRRRAYQGSRGARTVQVGSVES